MSRGTKLELALVVALGLALTGCTKPAPKVEPAPAEAPVDAPAAAPALNVWTAAAEGALATRTVPLDGGGTLELSISCDLRPNADPILNGFWLKLSGQLAGENGAALDVQPEMTVEDAAILKAIRSTGEEGTLMATQTAPGQFLYENNQTNELNNDNNDPTKVEMAQSFELPLSDGRKVLVDMQKSDEGYMTMMGRCAALMPG